MKNQILIILLTAITTVSDLCADNCYNDGMHVRCIDERVITNIAPRTNEFANDTAITNSDEIFSSGAMRQHGMHKQTEKEEKMEQEHERKKEQNKN